MATSETPAIRINRDSFRLTPVGLGAIVGGVVAFILAGAIVEVLWTVLGVLVGAGIGLAVHRLLQGQVNEQVAIDLTDESRAELQKVAGELGIAGRSRMNKDELARAIAERQSA